MRCARWIGSRWKHAKRCLDSESLLCKLERSQNHSQYIVSQKVSFLFIFRGISCHATAVLGSKVYVFGGSFRMDNLDYENFWAIETG